MASAALECLPGAGMVLDANARMVLGNRAAQLRYPAMVAGQPGPVLDADHWRLTFIPGTPFLLARERPQTALAWLPVLAQRWNLTAREAEVLSVMADGTTNEGVALRLDCATKTVETHVSRILEKAGLPSRAAVIAQCWAVCVELIGHSSESGVAPSRQEGSRAFFCGGGDGCLDSAGTARRSHR